jgi:hypothetical protein
VQEYEEQNLSHRIFSVVWRGRHNSLFDLAIVISTDRPTGGNLDVETSNRSLILLFGKTLTIAGVLGFIVDALGFSKLAFDLVFLGITQ